MESTNFAPYVIAAGFALCAFLALYRLNLRKRFSARYRVPLLVALPLFCVLCIAIYNRPKPEPIPEPKPAKWEPPELPPGCSNVFVRFGSETMMFPAQLVPQLGEKGIHLVDGKPLYGEVALVISGKSYLHPVLPEIKSNRFYLSVTIPHANEQKRISMDNALDRHLPPRWDRNYSSNAFEIVREDNTPVLQVVYFRAEVIAVYGVFVLDSTHIFVTFGPTNSIWLQNLKADNASVLVDESGHILVDEKGNVLVGEAGEVLQTAAFSADFVKRNPLFKYPSYRFPGVFAE